MKVVILAAGKSSRFYPFTNLKHKSLLSLLGKTLLEHTLDSIKETGIKEVVIVIGKDQLIKDLIGDGRKFGLTITYVIQPEPLGMGDALLRVKEHIEDYFFLLHAHHIDFSDFKKLLESKRKNEQESVLLAKEEVLLEKFGVLKMDGDRVEAIVEKPLKGQEPSKFRVVGIYLLHKAFFETLDTIPLTHYNLEEAISQFAKKATVRIAVTDKQTVTLKYPWDVFHISRYLLEKNQTHISKDVLISKNVVITGDVTIEEGAKIMEGACIKGPCYIGKNAFIGNNAVVRNGSIIEENAVVGAKMELKNSVLLAGTKVHSGFIGDSIIGKNCRIAANFTTGNVRLDRNSVKVKIGDKDIDTDIRSLGVIVGDDVKVGISVSTMPGIMIGNNAIIGPSTTIMEHVEYDTTVYNEFKLIRKKNK